MIARPISILAKLNSSINKKKIASSAALLALALTSATAVVAAPPVVAPELDIHKTSEICPEQRAELEKGEVVVGLKNVGETKFVTGKIIINQPPDKVWPIMVNPFEFQGKISPRVKKVEVFTDEANLSVMKMTMDTSPIPFLPQLTYTVESRYQQSDKGGRIEFHRVAGMVRDFRGYWDMAPACGGTKTELTYSMYVDPGFFLPQWIVRESVKSELPRTLTALRKRITGVYDGDERLERHTIVAANPYGHHLVH